MSQTFVERIHVLGSSEWISSLQGIKRGFEKESLRVDEQGNLAKTEHPRALGSSLTHPFITTDYSEALLEFITPPLSDLDTLFDVLTDLHQYVYHILKKEPLWTASMPCFLPQEEEIPIANYGHSNIGKLKHIYRRGLGRRYGQVMQTIAGIHYNFSLPKLFWEKYQHLLGSKLSEKDFISEQYLHLSRNVLRFGWLLPLLMGASPAMSSSFLKEKKTDLKVWNNETLIGPYATSLRLSDLGYHNKTQLSSLISYNSYSEFLQTMKKAVHTVVPEYRRIGVQKNGEYLQLSDKIFQIEDEHYALVRPKRVSTQEERMMAAILREGIEYIEVRALDVNPFVPIGIEKEMVYFLDAFLMTCLLMESPPLTDAENQQIVYNHTKILEEGLKPGVNLMGGGGKPRLLTDLCVELLEKIQIAAGLLDQVYVLTAFTESCEIARERVLAPQMLPSARVLREMSDKQESYCDFAWRWSLQHQHYFKSKNIDPVKLNYYQTIAQDSIKHQEKIEGEDKLSFDEYLKHYLEV